MLVWFYQKYVRNIVAEEGRQNRKDYMALMAEIPFSSLHFYYQKDRTIVIKLGGAGGEETDEIRNMYKDIYLDRQPQSKKVNAALTISL